MIAVLPDCGGKESGEEVGTRETLVLVLVLVISISISISNDVLVMMSPNIDGQNIKRITYVGQLSSLIHILCTYSTAHFFLRQAPYMASVCVSKM